jgi:calcium-dependent protein kinase
MGNCCTRKVEAQMHCIIKANTTKTEITGDCHTLQTEDNTDGFFCLEDISKYYTIIESIGKGHYSTVYKAHLNTDISKKFAIKSVDKKRSKNAKTATYNEIMILSLLDHPNIVKFYEVYEDKSHIHIVMEYCAGKSLTERINKRIKLSEKEAAEVVFKVTSAILHCHSKGIVHRDIKPQNVIFTHSSGYDIKLIDFGLSKLCEDQQEMVSFVGTPYYVSPDVLSKSYGLKCDIWGIGILLYVSLCGRPPFCDITSKKDLYKKIKCHSVLFDPKQWEDVSEDAVDLVRDLLNKDPEQRPDARSVLTSEWLRCNGYSISNQRPLGHKISKYFLTSLFKVIASCIYFNIKWGVGDIRHSYLVNYGGGG